MRNLTTEERKITQSSIKNLESEIRRLSYHEKITLLTIEEGLQISFEHQLKQLKAQLHDVQQNLEVNRKALAIAQDQLEHGVEIKKNTGGTEK